MVAGIDDAACKETRVDAALPLRAVHDPGDGALASRRAASEDAL